MCIYCCAHNWECSGNGLYENKFFRCGNFQTPQSCQFLNRSLFRSSPMVIDFVSAVQVQVTEIRFLRRVPSEQFHDKVRSCEIRGALNVEPLLFRIERSQLRWFGHVTRICPEKTGETSLLAKPTRKRPRGRPRTR